MDNRAQLQPEPVPDAARNSLTPERWRQIKEVFGRVLDCDPNARDTVLQETCGGDESLRAEVQSLLAAADGNSSNTSEMVQSIVSPAVPQLLPKEAEDRMLGRRIGAYSLERRIGFGGMASVYLAARADDEYRKQVAIKLLRPELDNTELLKRFRAERQTLASLDHPNIVKLLDGGSTADGLPFLVMEYVDGRPIDEYCDAHKLPIEGRLRLFCAVCEAVRCAHQSQVIHRDLKPSNILVTDEGTPKLLDFGIAKVLAPPDPAQALITLTATRHLTPAYASPEQIRGEPVSPATDVYSLGVVLYELLTGHRPYRLKQRTPAELERAICEQAPESPSTAIDRVESEKLHDGTTTTKTVEDISRTRESGPAKLRRNLRGDLDNILLKALQKDAKRRYANVEEFEQDIQRHINHQPVQARPSTFAYSVSKFVTRHRSEVMASAAVMLVVLGAAGFLAWEQHRATEKARAEILNQRSGGRRSVAVLGFKNLSERPDAAWLSTAFAEMLTTELSAGGKLRTIPGEDVAHAKADLSLPDSGSLSKRTLLNIRNSLGSDFVVLGSYVANADRSGSIRLDLRLQDARIGATVVSVAESGSQTELSDLVARLGTGLRQRLGIPPLTAAESASVQALDSHNPQALRHYQEGLAKLRAFDALGASELLQKAVTLDPSFALAHAALADAWSKLGYDVKARDEAKKALEASHDLPREQSLWIEGRYYETTEDSEKAADVFHTLFNFFPDNTEYGLHLAEAQIELKKPDQGLETIRTLRKLDLPVGRDPRIDLTEANAAHYRQDYKHELEMGVQAEQRAQAQESRLLAAEALEYQARANRLLGDLKQSIAVSEKAEQIFAAVGDHYGEARALEAIGSTSITANDLAGANKAYQRALEINHQLGNKVAEAHSLQGIGGVRLFQRDLPGAVDAIQRAIALRREMGKPTAVQVNNLGMMEKEWGHLAAARRDLETVLPAARQTNDKGLITACLLNLAQVAASQGDMREAKQLANEMVDVLRKAGSRARLGEGLVEAGDVELAGGDIIKAESFESEAAGIFAATKEEFDLSGAQFILAHILLAKDDVSGARKKYETVFAVQQREQGDVRDLFDSRVKLAEVSLEEGHAADAEEKVRDAESIYAAQNEPQARIEGDTMLVRSLVAQKKLSDARTVLASDEQLMSRSEDWISRVSTAIARAQFLAASGDFGKAIELLEATIEKCRTAGFGRLELEARLALGQAEMQAGRYAAARDDLRALGRDAKTKGFLLIAHKAIAARQRKSAPNP